MKRQLSILWLLSLVGGHPSGLQAGQMVYGETGRLDTFDPYTAHEASGARLADLLFDSLVALGPSGDYEPRLAASWTLRPGNTAVDFVMREGVPWHVTPDAESRGETVKRMVSPEDVVTTVRLVTAKGGDIPGQERFQALKAAEVLDDRRVRIHLKRAAADPLRAMLFKILPAHILGSAPSLQRTSRFARSPVGTGPYMFVSANAQGEVVLKANQEYFRRTPAIETIVMKAYADQNIMAQALMYGSLDLVTYVSPRNLPEVAGDRKLSIVPYDALSFSFIAMNTARAALADRRVRQAIGYAVNREEMLQAFFRGQGHLISGPFPPTSWAYNIDVQPMTHQPNKSKSLLAAAGWQDRNGDGVLEDQQGEPLSLTFAVPLAGESETIKRIVLAFQGYMQEIGVGIELKFMDWLVWKRTVIGKHDYDLTIASWSFDDASNITSLFHSSSAKEWGNNFVMYRNARVDALLTEADATSDFDKRRAIYHKLHAMLAEEAPYVYLWTLKHHAAHTADLSGVRIEPFAFFKYAPFWEQRG